MKTFPYPIQGHLLKIGANDGLDREIVDLLTGKFDVDLITAKAISSATSAMYSREGLHYHTAKHVMYILQNCKVNSIELETWEKLVILFHDVIYYPGKSDNEIASAMFMQSLLLAFIGNCEVMELAVLGIEETAKFMQDDGVNPIFNRILDLDLMGLACDWHDYKNANNDIEKEFAPVVGSKFLSGRANFLQAMLDRKSIYRSPEFACLEEKARDNMSRELKAVLPFCK